MSNTRKIKRPPALSPSQERRLADLNAPVRQPLPPRKGDGLRVILHPADSGGCGSYRMIWPGEALVAQGHDVIVDYDRTYPAIWQPSAFDDRIVDLHEPIDADVVVLQRPLRQHTYDLIRALQGQGIACVIEIDDDFHAIHPRNPAWKHTRQLDDPAANREWLKKSCEIADLVTVTTPALAARYGGHGRVAVLPNYVPERYLGVRGITDPGPDGGRGRGQREEEHPARVSDDGGSGPESGSVHGSGPRVGGEPPPVVGWSGSTDTHPGDLEVTKGAVARAVADSAARFHVVGTGRGVARALGLQAEPTSTGWLPIADYPAALTAFDIGIVPLKASQFNEAKSALKMMEYAASGSVPIGSPTTDNLRVRGLGVGEVAAEPDAWYEAICRLASDSVRRAEVQARSVEAMRDLTIEKQAWRWMEAWESATARKAVA